MAWPTDKQHRSGSEQGCRAVNGAEMGQNMRKGGSVRGVVALTGVALVLAACSDFDLDMRPPSSGFTTADSVREMSPSRPAPDSRGVISYPNFQVAIARSGDTVARVAERVGVSATELARFNALPPDTALRAGEVLSLPGGAGPGSGPDARPRRGDDINITRLAEGAIDRAEAAEPRAAAQDDGAPRQHRVERGETAFSIARLYGVPARALADWNGLDADLTVREGQILLIPATDAQRTAAAAPTRETTPEPGSGSTTPSPPSAAQPMPEPAPSAEEAERTAAAERPEPPAMAEDRTETSSARLRMPIDGRIIRAFNPGRFDGIGIAASAGTQVRAAAAGTVAAITRDTNQVPIVVIRHEGDLMTVYANLDDLRVERNDRVSAGQTIATVRAGDPSFLHFEVREGFEAVDPMPLLQ